MSDLADFLLARIAEDEEVAREAVCWSEGAAEWADAGEPDWRHIARWDPARVLAECEAKRRIVESRSGIAMPSREVHDEVCRQREYVWRLLALLYADHPEYRQEWRDGLG